MVFVGASSGTMRSVEKAGGGISAANLDTRLLRFRNRPSGEDGRALAAELLEAGRNAEAVEVATLALAQAPEDGALHLIEGQAHLRENDLIRAQAALLKAARFAPSDKEPFRWLGEVLLKRGDPQRAVKVLERARALDPTDRAIQLLHQRSLRFARIAASDGEAEAAQASKAAFERPDVDDYDEATVVAQDVSRRLADRTRDDLPGEGLDTRVDRQPAGKTPSRQLEDYDDEDVPTTIASRDDIAIAKALAEHERQANPPPRARRAAKRTMVGLGAPAEANAPAPPSPWASPAPAAPPPSAVVQPPPAAPPPARPRAKPTMLGVGQQRAPLPGRGKEPAAESFGPDPFARGGAFEDVTTDARVPAAPPPERAKRPPFDPPADDLREPARREPTPVTAPPSPVPAPPHPPAADDLDEHFPQAFAEALDEDETSEAAPPEEAPDVTGGEQAGQEEDVDGVLRMLEREGIFEAPTGAAAQWATRKEAARSATRIGRVLLGAWVAALLLAAGGWFGWQKWVEHRHQEAARLVEEAGAKALEGDHADLVDAERNLRVARDLDPHTAVGPAEMIFVHAQRALEDGAFEPGYLRPSIRRGERMEVEAGRVNAANAVLAAAEGDMDGAREQLRAALEASPEDAAVLYIAGRIKQRLGADDALDDLAGAIEKEPALSAAAIALAEARADEGRRDEAIELLDGVLGRTPDHLRATLWKVFVTADEADPAEGLARVDGLGERLEVGAPTDRVLAELTRARLLRRQGQVERAAEAVDRAGEAGATEPRLLALVASEAKAVNRLSLAQAAATNAVAGAPTNADFRKLLAQILIDRRDGVRALRTLGAMSMDDPEVLRMSAEAALIVGTGEALAAAAEALNGYLEGNEEASVEMRALRIRALVALGQGREVLGEARQLASDAPGDPLASRALGEAALAAYEPRIATEALSRLVQSAPDDPDGHYLLGRAQRLGSDADEAERSFRRALEILPEHTDARLALGRLLLDGGKYAEADELYQELARQSGIASGAATALLGRLGRVEALLGLGRVDDASVQMESVRSQDRETMLARIAAAQLALAKNQPGEAVGQLRPLAESERPPADVVALFGDALFEAGEVDAANQQYERALEIDRGLPEALLGKAKVAVRAENERDARAYLDDVAESLGRRIRPPRMRATMHLLRGRSFLQDGRSGRDAARRALREAVQIDGVPAEAWFWLGEALSGDNAPESREAYQRYLELAPEGAYASRAQRALR